MVSTCDMPPPANATSHMHWPQVFPADAPGVYYNSSELGLVSAKLRGEFGVNESDPTRIDLEFKDLALSIGPFQVLKKVRQYAHGHMCCVVTILAMRRCIRPPGSKQAQRTNSCRANCCLPLLCPYCPQDFAPGAMRGYWKLRYMDEGFRAFDTNQGNLFVLVKEQ